MWWRIVYGSRLMAAVFLLLAGMGPAAAAEDEIPQYVLSAGDEIGVTVFGEEDLSGTHKIDNNGMISMPLIGDIRAVGKTMRQIEKTIADMYRGRFLIKPRVTVEMLNFRPFYVLGEVKEPGSYAFHAGMKVMNAVALAGGFTYRADEEELFIIRAGAPDGKPQPATTETIVMPGDTVKVGQRFF